ncbi:MAG: hypothetical protein U0L88_02590 [Acutalibacteraceae bacterium]|nr:hypothetical protein [Acutalibacteraceae bacterium]
MKYERLTDKDIPKEVKHKLCIVLCDIRRRCLNPDYKYFYLYGERGITVCDEWMGKEGQKNFREWAVNNGYEQGLTIDRIDNNKGYSPQNCRWVTAKEQSYNRRSNKLITIKGKTQTVTEWAKEMGLSVGALQNRLRYGWEEDRLLEPKQVHLKMSKHEMRLEILKLRKQLEEYKNKIENGTLVELPCKVGDEIWEIIQSPNGNFISREIIGDFWITEDGIVARTGLYTTDSIEIEEFGETLFLTKAEAEQKLKELEE